MDRKQMIHYAIIALLLVSIALLGYHIKQMKDMASAERFNVPGDTANAAEHFRRQKDSITAAERFNVPGDTANAAEHFRRKNDLSAERFDKYTDERFGMPPHEMSAHLHTRLNRNTGRLYTGEAFGMRKRLN